MLAVLITILFTYFFTTLFGYVIHWALHQPWAGRFNQAHMTHHLTLYPPSDFTSEKYRHAGKDNTVKTFAIASIPVILLPILLFWFGVLPLHIVIITVVLMVSIGLLHDHLHNTFHLTNHWLYRVPVIRLIMDRWVQLHYIHHVDMQKNFGIFSFHWDHIFKTFKG
jgi:hypothetical protein